MSETTEVYCCHMDCGPGEPAEFEIHGEHGHPEDVTHACREHIGDLLSTPTWKERKNRVWHIYLLPSAGGYDG